MKADGDPGILESTQQKCHRANTHVCFLQPYCAMLCCVVLYCPVLLCAAAAVKSAEAQLSKLSKSELQDVLRYHIVPAPLPIPSDLQAGKAYPTAFKGHSLRFKYNK